MKLFGVIEASPVCPYVHPIITGDIDDYIFLLVFFSSPYTKHLTILQIMTQCYICIHAVVYRNRKMKTKYCHDAII